MGASKNTLKFKEHETIVYPLQGVGIIQSVEERKFKGKKIWYYIIYFEATDMTVMIPTTQAKEIGLRSIISNKKAENLFANIEAADDFMIPSDWKLRYQSSLEQMRDGSILEIAAVLKALYLRSKTKDLPIMERKLYDSSFKALITELSIALKKPELTIREMLITKFENSDRS